MNTKFILIFAAIPLIFTQCNILNNKSGEKDSDPPAELVIMPLGDSLTNDVRSRETLWNLLVDDGFEVDYVGNQHQESSIPDPDHEGVGGIKIQGIADKIVSLMEEHNPAYINLMVGTNDIGGGFSETGVQIAEHWNELVQLILDNMDDNAYLIAATIPPESSEEVGSQEMEERDRAVVVQQYNAAIREYVEMHQDAGYRIVLADMEAEMNLDDHVWDDGIHLTTPGYEVMGTVYYDAIISTLD
ncbi:MAG: GDSL-type esterase/lipase family protein [Balneolaceae bacterium]